MWGNEVLEENELKNPTCWMIYAEPKAGINNCANIENVITLLHRMCQKRRKEVKLDSL